MPKGTRSKRQRGTLEMTTSIPYLHHLNTFCITLHNPLFRFGSTVAPHLGQSTGADQTVAAHSMSGARNVLPQWGQVTMIVPLTIVVQFFKIQRILGAALEKDAAGGDCDGSDEELDRDFSDFCHGMSVLVVVDEGEQPVDPIVERLADDEAEIQAVADYRLAAFDESVGRLRAKELF